MLFNSGAFLAAFAAFAVIYYATAHRFRWMLLLAASLAFYAMLSIAYVPLLVAVTLVAYAGGLAIERASNELFDLPRCFRMLSGATAPPVPTVPREGRACHAPKAPGQDWGCRSAARGRV